MFAPYGDSVSSGKKRAILAGSPNAGLSCGLSGVGGPASLDGLCACGKSFSDILFFLMFPCAGGLAAVPCLVSGWLFIDRTSALLGLVAKDIVTRSRGGAEKLVDISGVVVREIWGVIERIMLNGIVGPR